jgi:hypothetical protein
LFSAWVRLCAVDLALAPSMGWQRRSVHAQGPVAAVGVATAEIAKKLHIETQISAVVVPGVATAPSGHTDSRLYPSEGGRDPAAVRGRPYAEKMLLCL